MLTENSVKFKTITTKITTKTIHTIKTTKNLTTATETIENSTTVAKAIIKATKKGYGIYGGYGGHEKFN